MMLKSLSQMRVHIPIPCAIGFAGPCVGAMHWTQNLDAVLMTGAASVLLALSTSSQGNFVSDRNPCADEPDCYRLNFRRGIVSWRRYLLMARRCVMLRSHVLLVCRPPHLLRRLWDAVAPCE